MAGRLHGVLAAAELEDADLFATAVGKDGRGDRSAFDRRIADLEAFFAADGENFGEGHLSAGFNSKGFNLELVADGNAVLLTASLDNSVHVINLARSASPSA